MKNLDFRKNSILLCVVTFVLLNSALADEIPNDELRFYKCKIRAVGVSNIDIISRQELFDVNRKPVNNIDRGVIELFVANSERVFKKNEHKHVVDLLEKMKDWKTLPKNPSGGDIVGLVESAVDTLVILGNKCWLIRINSDRIYSIEAEIILENNNINIATAKWGEKPKSTDNEEIIGVFLGIVNNLE